MTPNPNAFTRASTFSRAIEAFKRATGLSVKDGKLMTLHDGSRIIEFNATFKTHPFYATGTTERIRLNRGFVSYAGKTYYFPAATYSGASPGGVFLKLTTSYTASKFDVGSWSLMPVAATPELVWRSVGTVGEYCKITLVQDEDDPYDFEVVVGSTETLYIPIAGFSAGQVVNFITQNIFLMPQGVLSPGGEAQTLSGSIDYRDGWG